MNAQASKQANKQTNKRTSEESNRLNELTSYTHTPTHQTKRQTNRQTNKRPGKQTQRQTSGHPTDETNKQTVTQTTKQTSGWLTRGRLHPSAGVPARSFVERSTAQAIGVLRPTHTRAHTRFHTLRRVQRRTRRLAWSSSRPSCRLTASVRPYGVLTGYSRSTHGVYIETTIQYAVLTWVLTRYSREDPTAPVRRGIHRNNNTSIGDGSRRPSHFRRRRI